MKTLVVLSALAAVALAAPAFEEGAENFKKTFSNVAENFKRERKSPHESIADSNQGAPVNSPASSQNLESSLSARTFALKKPIIIKKKQGYHVYRDSNEEQVESDETCNKQVKVKLCDVKQEDNIRSSTIKDMNTHMTEEDMKQNIRLAKEAVENLQRDLQIVERKPNTKTSPWQHGQSESDAELHQDIEVAREALEHIHKNFGNLESMSLHATTLDKADSVQDTHISFAKSEEERLAQWKEAIDTIHKNFEIVKNIEHSFKSKAASDETGLLFNEDMMVHNNKQDLNKMTDFMRKPEDVVPEAENKAQPESCLTDFAHEKSSDKGNSKTGSLEDMASAASTTSEKRSESTLQNSEKARQSKLDTDIQIDKTLNIDKSIETAHKEKNAELETMKAQDQLHKSHLVSDSMKIITEDKNRNAETGQNIKPPKLTDSTDNVPASHKSVETEDLFQEQERNASPDDHQHQDQKFLNHEKHEKLSHNIQHMQMKSAEHLNANASEKETSEKVKTETKSPQQFNNDHNGVKKESKTQSEEQHAQSAKEVDTTMLMKSVEQMPMKQQRQLLEDVQRHFTAPHKDQLDQHSHTAKMARQEAESQQAEMFTPSSNAEQLKTNEHIKSLQHSEIRATEDSKSSQHQQQINQHHQQINQHHQQLNQHQLVDPHQTRWAEDKNFHMHMESMKAADGMQSQTVEHAQRLQHPGHLHPAHGMKNHHFEHTNDQFIPQAKSADMDMQSYYMRMRDNSGMGSENPRLRWKPMHESMRSAYGAPASAASSGAVGVFPDAKVGACGIPLLLSCNPSVVRGDLAKPQPSYSAPAYRSEGDFNFHTKRDVKKTHENHPTLLQNKKTGTVLVAKQ